MGCTMTVQSIIIALILFLIVFVYPVKAWYDYTKLLKNQTSKLEMYTWLIADTLLPTLLIIISVPFAGMHFHEIGLRKINVHASTIPAWIIFLTIGIYIVYLAYTIYSMINITFSKKSREQAAKGIPSELKNFLPVTRSERKLWVFVALNAGFTEEILYRGFLFYAIAYIFPDVSLPAILGISTVMFGLGHIYQKFEVIKPTIMGLLFGYLYIVFDSIIPVMIIHFMQDVVVTNLLCDDQIEPRGSTQPSLTN